MSQNTFIPNDNFEQALINLGFDAGPLDDFVPTANINTITSLDVSNNNIADLTGIEDFSALSSLNCENNLLLNLVVNQNIALTELFCSNNSFSTLDISLLLELKILWCANNQITNLNVANNTKLISLVCGDNQLTDLDVTKNTVLNVLVCENNLIPSIDVTKNVTLNRFQCGNNKLTGLDVTKNTNLSYLDCAVNQITFLDLSKNNILDFLNVGFNTLTVLDVSQNPILTKINCSNNDLCRLNIKNGNNGNIVLFDFLNNPNLNCVVVDNPLGNHPTWVPLSFSNYVTSQVNCNSFVNIDTLNDFIGVSYMLPPLINGNYFTASSGNGIPLFVGDIIASSQTIYIFNETTCDSNESSFNVLITNEDYYIPKYFTPNNDGNHDYWRVINFTNSIKKIEVFNRHGKLLKSLPPNSTGWNGTYNGNLLKSDDYWFLITFYSGETLNGHFALKR